MPHETLRNIKFFGGNYYSMIISWLHNRDEEIMTLLVHHASILKSVNFQTYKRNSSHSHWITQLNWEPSTVVVWQWGSVVNILLMADNYTDMDPCVEIFKLFLCYASYFTCSLLSPFSFTPTGNKRDKQILIQMEVI